VNISEYIESGILEAYLLGSLSKEEEQKVVADVERYPELAAELLQIENTLLQLSASVAVEPPAELKDKIWMAIKDAGLDNEGVKQEARKIPLPPPVTTKMQWRYAAVWGALIISLVYNAYLVNSNKQSSDDRLALNAQMATLHADQQKLAGELADYRKNKTMMADTGMQTVVMHTMLQGHPMAATVYWSKSKGDTYVSMDGLPQAPKGMQYQLWVIQNGKPVSMGVLPNDMAGTPAMEKVAMAVTNGDAFAISLEKEGGNPTPTSVYVLGKV
jgi:anti-sigma-K factor RskA